MSPMTMPEARASRSNSTVCRRAAEGEVPIGPPIGEIEPDAGRQQLEIAASHHQRQQKRGRLAHRQRVARGDEEADLDQEHRQADVAQIDRRAAHQNRIGSPSTKKTPASARMAVVAKIMRQDETRGAAAVDREARHQRSLAEADGGDEIIGLQRVEIGILRRERRGHRDEHRLEEIGDEEHDRDGALEIERDEA